MDLERRVTRLVRLTSQRKPKEVTEISSQMKQLALQASNLAEQVSKKDPSQQ